MSSEDGSRASRSSGRETRRDRGSRLDQLRFSDRYWPHRSRVKGSSRSGGRHRRSSGCGNAHASRKRPGDHTPSPVRSSCRREASSRSTSESSEEVRVELPPPTAGRSLTGGTPSVSQSASAGDRSPRSGPADRSRTGLGVVCPPSFGRG